MNRFLPVLAMLLTASLVETAPPSPESHHIDGFECFQQPDDISCGPACGLMLLRRYKKRADFESVKRAAKTNWLGMTHPDGLRMALKTFAVPSEIKTGSVGLLKHHIASRRPVIALVRSSVTDWHYVVVVGYDGQNVALADPAFGAECVLGWEVFTPSWGFRKDICGRDVGRPCFLCEKGWRFCPLCGSTGESPDCLAVALEVVGVRPNTMLVPEGRLDD